MEHHKSILIAGFGNVLRGDDGFGVEVVKVLLQRDNLPKDVEVIEVGIGGVSLVQTLMDGYQTLIVVDAVKQDGAPGTLYLLQPQMDEFDADSESLIDMHFAEPSRALKLAKAVGVLPKKVFIVGCEPNSHDDLELGLSSSVQRAVSEAVNRIISLIKEIQLELQDA